MSTTIDITAIERLVRMTEKSHLQQISISDGEQAVSVVNKLNTSAKNKTTKQNHHPTSMQVKGIESNGKTSSKDTAIRSPYVGRIHLSKDGASDDLIMQGDTINQGQTLCFVEVLSKLLPVISDTDGQVTKILLNSGDAVEYGQPIASLVVDKG